MAALPLATGAAMLAVPVFPCAADKRPLTPHGHKDATLDPRRISELFADLRAALVGMPTGGASNLIAIDIDVKDGAAGQAWLDSNRHRLPPTLKHRTRSGGWHLLFRPPVGIEIRNSAGKLAPGVDVRGDGGFVIVPPSPGYSVEHDAEPAELPDWLLAELVPAPEPERPTISDASRHMAGDNARYVRAALADECEAIRIAPFGRQEATLNRAAVKVGGYVAGGHLAERLAAAELLAAGTSMPNQQGRERWTIAELDRKIRRGLADGKREPKHPPERVSLGAHPAAELIANARRQTSSGDPMAGVEHGSESPNTASAGLVFSDPSTLGDVEPPEREWIVPDWLPAGAVTLLYANGGEGKSLLALQLATACATGWPWLGLVPQRCRAMVLACEDDADELHRRQARINAELGVGMADLGGNLRWSAPCGDDNVLLRFGRDGAPSFTERFRQLRAAALEFRPGLIVLDTAADLFGGNENDRAHVSAFLKACLGSLARDTGAAVLLLAHPSRAGIASGDLDGGSTAWNGAVRSRWSLVTPTGDGGHADPGVRVLSRRKANYSSRGDEIRMRFRAGVLVRDGYASTSADMSRPSADVVFMALLDRMTASGDRLSTSPNAGRFAPRMFAGQPDRAGYGRRELEAAMWRLMADGRLKVVPYGPPSAATTQLVRADGPTSEAASPVLDGASTVLDGPENGRLDGLDGVSEPIDIASSTVARRCPSTVSTVSQNPLISFNSTVLDGASTVPPQTPCADTRTRVYACEDAAMPTTEGAKPWHRPAETIDQETGEILPPVVGPAGRPWRHRP